MTEVSETIVAQRIRNRIIENLSHVSILENVAKFGAFESINSWDDWMCLPLDTDLFKAPVFNQSEIDSLLEITALYDLAANATKTDIFDENTLKDMRTWKNLETACKASHSLFMQRGKFSEEKEAFDV